VRIGVLTGGGDCPGLNAVIRAIVRKGVEQYGHEFLGYRDGWRGPLERNSRPLGVPEVRGILPRGGTILGSSRTNPFKEEGGAERIAEHLRADGVDGLIAIGGEDTLGAASRLFERGVNVVGVPKTIDNDLSATDYTFGFDTAVNIAMSAIDRLHTTAESHRRTLICEVMGRNAGWIAFHAGLSGGANVILIPEIQFDLDRVTDYIVHRFESQYSPIVVVAEGAEPRGGMPSSDGAPTDAFGHVRLGGIANWLEGEIERGGTPTAFDRVLATRFGLHAIDAAHEGQWGKMAALRSTDIQLVDLTEATAELKTVPESLYREAEVFFG
jgi:ATP-dependent phosphofructokinase / diphosphate-dependent phosphofructokinase